MKKKKSDKRKETKTILKAIIISMIIFIIILITNNIILQSGKTEEKAIMHLSIAKIYESKGETEKAINEIEQAIKISPKNDLAYSLLGDIYLQTGQYNNSLQAYQKALEIKKGAEYYFDVANAYNAMGDKDNAMKNYIKTIELDPDAPIAFLNIANILLEQERYPESKIYYDKALELNYYNSDVHNDLGVYYKETGNIEKAKEEYKLALQIDPSNTLTRKNLELINEE